jgi:hypothetical protein
LGVSDPADGGGKTVATAGDYVTVTRIVLDAGGSSRVERLAETDRSRAAPQISLRFRVALQSLEARGRWREREEDGRCSRRRIERAVGR